MSVGNAVGTQREDAIMLYFPWPAIAWLEFWSEMSRAWLLPSGVAPNDQRVVVVPFPTARVRTHTAVARAAGAHIVRLSV